MVDWGTVEFYPLNLASNMSFKAKLHASEDATGSLLCLGLDPEPDLLPPSVERSPAGIATFVRTIVEAVADSVSSYKLNLAFYERWGREASWLLDQAMAALPKDRPVIFDAKRGDVGSTAQAYAHATFEAWGADAITVHSYLGYDSVAPFLAHKDKEVFIVCRTSNPGAAEFQHLRVDGEALYRHVARAAVRWDHHDNIGFVVGATAPAEIRDVRQIAGDRLLLVPGIGAQGGELAASLPAALRPDGRGAIIPISRGILFASAGADYADAARAAAQHYRDAINADGRRAGYSLIWAEETELDHGVVVPLHSLPRTMANKRCIFLGVSGWPLQRFVEFGGWLHGWLRDRAVILIASGDLSHRL